MRMPRTDKSAGSPVAQAATTGLGIASRRAETLGRIAAAANMTPIHTPTLRAAIPVGSVIAMLVE